MTRVRLREQIEFLRFLLVAGLVLLHYGSFPGSDQSPFRGWDAGPHGIASFVNSFVLFFFFSAVPLLAAISGWLFFKDFETTPAFFLRRLRARSRSILLPMVLWNLIVLAAFIGAALVGADDTVLSLVAYDVTDLTAKDAVNALFGITRHPVQFQFWFLRDLFLTILLAPLLGMALRHVPVTAGAVLAAVWLSGFDLWIFFRTDVLFFFYLGGMMQVRRVAVTRAAPRTGFALMTVFAALVAARTLGPHYLQETSSLGVFLFEHGSRLMRAVGVVALWLVAPVLVATAVGQAMVKLGSVAFFLHAFHWPVNQVIKHGLARLVPGESDALMLFNYVATGGLTVLCTTLAARVLSRVSPALYDILSGGRARPVARRDIPAGASRGM